LTFDLIKKGEVVADIGFLTGHPGGFVAVDAYSCLAGLASCPEELELGPLDQQVH
jgi:hypothetical protein